VQPNIRQTHMDSYRSYVRCLTVSFTESFSHASRYWLTVVVPALYT
jgi:hypothetical protein